MATFDEHLEVIAARGEVLVMGPRGVAIYLTADAAVELAQRLLTKAGDADLPGVWVPIPFSAAQSGTARG